MILLFIKLRASRERSGLNFHPVSKVLLKKCLWLKNLNNLSLNNFINLPIKFFQNPIALHWPSAPSVFFLSKLVTQIPPHPLSSFWLDIKWNINSLSLFGQLNIFKYVGSFIPSSKEVLHPARSLWMLAGDLMSLL